MSWWRFSGLMVGALDSAPSDLGSSPGWDFGLHSWARHFTLIMALHPGVKMDTSKFNAGNVGIPPRWSKVR